MILPKKNKKMLTVNYNIIENDFGLKNNQKVSSPLLTKTEEKKMVVVNGLWV